MRAGYLYIQTHMEHPGLVRVRTSAFSPATGGDHKIAIPYIARFSDLDAAKMHFHAARRVNLVDIDASLYKLSLVEAIATIEAEALPHRRAWLDPALGRDKIEEIEMFAAKHRRSRRLRDLVWHTVGLLALLMLLLNALSSLV